MTDSLFSLYHSGYHQKLKHFCIHAEKQGHRSNHNRHGLCRSSSFGVSKKCQWLSLAPGQDLNISEHTNSWEVYSESIPQHSLWRSIRDTAQMPSEAGKEKLLCSTVQMMFNINAISKSSYTTSTENIRYFFRRGDLLYTCTLMIILNQCVSVSGPEGVTRHRACAVFPCLNPTFFFSLFFPTTAFRQACILIQRTSYLFHHRSAVMPNQCSSCYLDQSRVIQWYPCAQELIAFRKRTLP